jgi:DNA polymerase elongation subunit (family B)
MFSKEKFSRFLFFDIETCGEYRNYEEFKSKDPVGAAIFKKKAERLSLGDVNQAYLDKVSLFPEFGKIACLSFGVWKEGEIKVNTISNENEAELIKSVYALFVKASANGMTPTGWNIKNFDIAWIYRKLMSYGYNVPECLNTFDKKPWEISIFDMKDWWKAFSSLDVSFEEAVYEMGIPSPKDDIDGSMVHTTYWNGEIDRIITYCEKDVTAMIKMCEAVYKNSNKSI